MAVALSCQLSVLLLCGALLGGVPGQPCAAAFVFLAGSAGALGVSARYRGAMTVLQCEPKKVFSCQFSVISFWLCGALLGRFPG